jgi:tetratricopeptide (TPR) repeat protein
MSVALNLAVRDLVAEGRAALLAGDAEAAAALFQERAQADPADFESRYGLYSALTALGADEAAAVMLADARVLQAVSVMRELGADVAEANRSPQTAVALAKQLYAARYVATASVAYGLAVSAGDQSPDTLLSFALSLQHQGRVEEAIQVFRALTELYPNPVLHQFLLVPHFYAADGIARHAAEARRWAELYAPPLAVPAFANRPAAGRKLRIGYVAPNFTSFQVRQFIQPIFDNHDRAAFEVFAYPAQAESLGEGIAVTPIGELDDIAAAALIRGHGIDVLIDCWGHTAGSRLGVFGQRAAPVQATWLNYQQTTGLSAMDYALVPQAATGPDADAAFGETVWSAGPVSAAFRPDGEAPVTRAPALANGYATFASFNNPAKLTDETVAAWARILKGVPTARLILKYGYFTDPVLREQTNARFAAHSVDPGRIEYRGHTTGETYVAEFGDVDLALDPSPVTGGTTSLEALSRGVPVLTLHGPSFYSRAALPIFLAAGLDELVAADWDDYVARAIALSADAAGLQALRERTRAGFAIAGYRDEAAVTRALETAFAGMFAALEASAGAARPAA